jgi:hypothetical protein
MYFHNVRRARLGLLFTIVALGAAWGPKAAADAIHALDVLVTSQSGTLVTGGFDHDTNQSSAPVRVFSGMVIGTAGEPFVSDGAPGFEAAPQADLDSSATMTPAGVYDALPPNEAIGFTFRPIAVGSQVRNLFYWSGSGTTPTFAPLAGTYSLSLTATTPWTRTISGTAAGVVAGATIATTGSNGSAHAHLTTEIAAGSGDPAQGFYLYALQFQVNGLAPSADAYFVYGLYDGDNPPDFAEFDAAHELALHWVEDNINTLVPVPEPATWILAACGAAASAGLRRRRRAAACGSAGNSPG